MISLYQVEWCPDCHRVRQVLTELGIPFTAVNVRAEPGERPELVAIAGQSSVPLLVDGDRVVGDSSEIVDYLRAAYTAPDDAAAHAARGAWRRSASVSLPPRAALARLEELLERKGFKVLARIEGPEIDDRLPQDYVLLQVTAPTAAAAAFETDPLAPVALVLPLAVVPLEDGTSTIAAADPVGQVWLYRDPALTDVQRAVKKLLAGLFGEL